jgi:arylsulfatase A-like enzyme
LKTLISQNSPESPNFIFILADDQGWNGTSVEMMNGLKESKSDFYETPNIEKLAKKGVKFSYAYSSAPVCAPSRYSIQFGQSPARLKMIRVGMNTDHIDHTSDFTIPKQLKKINPNYKTAHFGKWGMDSNPKILGYDKSDGATKNKQGGFNYDSNKLQWSNNFDEDPKKIFSVTERAIQFITKNYKNKNPFFLQISHYAIHSNLIMRKETFEKYNNKKAGKIHDNIGLASMTEDLDTSVGFVLDKLKELGIDKNTYVIYSSDNGSVPIIMPRKNYKNSYNHPLKRGKWDATEGGIRIPFIVTGPEIKPNSQAEIPISFSDLLPTIIDLAGGKENLKNEKLDGGSFKQVLLNKSKNIKRNFNGIVFHVPYENKIALGRAHSAIIVDKMKLIKFYDNKEIKLYNLKNDINENENLVFKRKKIAHNLEQKLSKYLKDVKAPKWKPGITWKWKTLKLINSYH